MEQALQMLQDGRDRGINVDADIFPHFPPSNFGWFETSAGEGLSISLSLAVQISAQIVYVAIDG